MHKSIFLFLLMILTGICHAGEDNPTTRKRFDQLTLLPLSKKQKVKVSAQKIQTEASFRDFINALRHRDFQAAHEVLGQHPQIINYESNGENLLHIVAKIHDAEKIADKLLDLGIPLNKRETQTSRNLSALDLAIGNDNDSMAAFLTSKGIDIETSFEPGLTYAHIAVTYKMPQFLRALIQKKPSLLETKSSLPIQNALYCGITPLIKAVNMNDFKMTDLLLSLGAAPHTSSNRGLSPLKASIYNNSKDEIVKRLLAAYDAHLLNPPVISLINLSIFQNKPKHIETFLTHETLNRNTQLEFCNPLNLALSQEPHPIKTIRQLLDHGINPLNPDELYRISPLSNALSKNYHKITKLILTRGHIPYNNYDEDSLDDEFQQPTALNEDLFHQQRYAANLKEIDQNAYIEFLNGHLYRHFKITSFLAREYLQTPLSQDIPPIINQFADAQEFKDLNPKLQQTLRTTISKRFNRNFMTHN